MVRHEAVLIRVSTDEQEHQGQIDNVRNMLTARDVEVPEQYWFTYTASRSKVSTSPEFQRFMAQVEADEISIAYVESRDRFGQTDPGEYFGIIAKLWPVP
jgi:DNA invertase Pin-like site-specific DNA recombinase